jgi:hypothetical protein
MNLEFFYSNHIGKEQNLSIVDVLKICSRNYKFWFPYNYWPLLIHTKCFYLMVLEEKSIIG